MLTREQVAEKRKIEESTDDTEPEKKKRNRGQNKKRAKFYKQKPDPKSRICPTLLREEGSCLYGDACKFSHDVSDYMSRKKPDISDVCYNFSTHGKCPFSYCCRYAGAHIVVEEGKYTNVTAEGKQCTKQEKNHSEKRVALEKLRKKKYEFTKPDGIVKAVTKMVAKEVAKKQAIHNKPKTVDVSEKVTDTSANIDESKDNVSDTELSGGNVGPVTDEDQFQIKPGEKKTIDFKNKLYLAPLTTVSTCSSARCPSHSYC